LQVAKDGDCLFAAVALHLMTEEDQPEVDADVLRRMAVWGLVQFPELLYPIVSNHLIGCYVGGEDSPGPFSYKSYCHFMLQAGNWGDEFIISLLGQMLI
jgi:hypothetical protein